MQGAEIREKLRSGARVYGTHIVETANPHLLLWESEAELDFVFICTEHISIDRKEVSWMCQLFAHRGISPMVRIPYPYSYLAAMMIDGGAQGIVAPYIETSEQVEELIGAVRYRPIKGRFLKDIIQGVRLPAAKLEKYLDRYNENTYLIIGIESVAAMENLEKLIGYEEVDGVFLGPHDLTCSMEIPEEYDNPLYIQAVKEIIQTCRRYGKGVGLHRDYGEEANRQMLEEGINFVLNGSDVMKARNALLNDFAALRGQYGDRYEPGKPVGHGNLDVCEQ